MTDDRGDEPADGAHLDAARPDTTGADHPAAPGPAAAPAPQQSAAPQLARPERRGGEPERRGAERRGNVYLLPGATAPTDGTAVEDADAVAATEDADATGPESPPGGDDAEREDWAWVREWRDGGEPTPWSTGVVIAAFAALLTGVAVWVLSAGLSDRPIVAVLVNLLVAAGLAPAIWLSRGLPVLRWIAAGAAVGIVIGWTSAVLMLPLPTP